MLLAIAAVVQRFKIQLFVFDRISNTTPHHLVSLGIVCLYPVVMIISVPGFGR